MSALRAVVLIFALAGLAMPAAARIVTSVGFTFRLRSRKR